MCAQSCLAVYDPVDCGRPGSLVHGILQARKLQWVSVSFSRRSSQSGIKLVSTESPALQVDSLPLEPTGKLLGYLGGPKSMTTVLTRNRREDRREEGHVRIEAEMSCIAAGQGMLGALRHCKRQRILLLSLERSIALVHSVQQI